MWALALFALLTFQASAFNVNTKQHVLASQEELVLEATIPSPCFLGQEVTFYVKRADDAAFSPDEQFEWLKDGQVVSQLSNYTMDGDAVGDYNITVVLKVIALAAYGKYSVTDSPLVISSSIPSPSRVGQLVTFYLKRANGMRFANDEHFEWRLDGITDGDNTNAFAMNSTVGEHNISCFLHVAQLYKSISYQVIEESPVLVLKISADVEEAGQLTVTGEFKPANDDISGVISFWLKDGKLIQMNFTGALVTFTKPLPLPMPTDASWLHAHYEGNGKYAVADSNYLHIMANGTVIGDHQNSPLGATSGSGSSTSTSEEKKSESDSLSRTNIILIAIAASIAFFVCCVCLFSRRNPHESVIHEPLAN